MRLETPLLQTLTQTSSAAPALRSREYRRDIDGLRAIAILSVVLFHAGVPALRGGFVGVDIFFVISGYLIGAHVYGDVRRRRFRIRDFYRKRAKRILPALLVVVGFTEIAGLLLLSPAELTMLSRYCIATLGSAANILAWLKSGYFASGADQNPLLMTWSLGIEEQFYIFFPLLMLTVGRIRRRSIFLTFAILTVASLVLCWSTTLRNPTAAFYLLPTRAWELAAGVLLAIYENGREPNLLYGKQRFANLCSIAGIALIAFSVLRFNGQTAFPGIAAALPVLGSALLIASPASYLNRFLLSSVPFVWIGQVSYSFYLWHWPLLSFAHIISDEPISIAMGCAIAAVSLLFAWISYRWVEQPFRTSETPAIPLLLRYAALCGALLVPAVVFHSTQGLPSRFAPVTHLEAARDDIARDCAGDKAPVQTLSCINRADPRPAVALIGDSHAAALAPAIAGIAEHEGFKLYRMIRLSCPPLIGVTRDFRSSASSRECLAYNARTMQLLVSDPKVRVVVITAYWAGPVIDDGGFISADQVGTVPSLDVSRVNLEQGLHATITRLRAAGKQIVILDDVPVFTFDPVRRMISDYIPIRSYIGRHLFRPEPNKAVAPIQETYKGPQQTTDDIVRGVAAAESVPVFDPKTNLCNNGECRFALNNRLLYRDNEHITKAGAQVAVAGLKLPRM